MKCKSIIEIEKELRKEKQEKKRDHLSRLLDPGQKGTLFVPDWRSRLGNRDNRGFPTGTNQRFCSSEVVEFGYFLVFACCRHDFAAGAGREGGLVLRVNDDVSEFTFVPV